MELDAKREARLKRFGAIDLPQITHKKQKVLRQTNDEKRKQLEQFNRRMDKFGQDHLTISEKKEIRQIETDLKWAEHKFPPRPILKDSKILQDTLLLYGVDFMSSDDIKKYFKIHGEVEIQWLDDSQALVKFEDDQTAKKAYKDIRLTVPR